MPPKREPRSAGGPSPKRSRVDSTPARGGPSSTSMSQVTAQKSRDQAEFSKYLNGSIVRITLHNFMTYDDIDLRPGPRMNFVIGPNGTGKSSLVLGRGKKEDAFVKKGRDSGFTEIELHNESGPNHVIKRQFQAEGASTTYNLNGKSATRKEVIDRIEQLGIQIDNLCHFLAQDKVADFVQLTKEERLVSTAKAVGRTDLIDLQKELSENQGAMEKLQQAVSTDEKSIETLDRQNQAIEGDALRLKERNRKRRDAKVLEVKLRAIQAMEQNEYAKSEKEKLKTVEDDLKAKDADIRALDVPTKKQAKKLMGLELSAKTANGQLKTTERECDKQVDRIDQVDVAIRDKEDSKRVLVQQKRNTEKKIAEKEKKRLEMVAKLEEYENFNHADTKAKVAELQANVKTKTTTLRAEDKVSERKQRENGTMITQSHDVAKAIQQLKKKDSQKLEFVRQRMGSRPGQPGATAYKAYKWIHDNKHLFEAEVYGPVILHLDLLDKNDAAMVEAMIGFQGLLSFIPQNDHDKDILLRQLYDTGTKIRIWQPPNQTFARLQDDQRKWPQLNGAGVQGSIDELFTCPEAVMQTLRAQTGVHNKLYGAEKALNNQQLWDSGMLNSLITRKNRMTGTRSRYGNKQVVTSSSALKPAQNMHICESVVAQMTELEQKKENLDALVSENEAAVREMSMQTAQKRKEIREMTEEIKGLGNVARQKVKLTEQIKLVDNQLDRLKPEVDITNATNKLDREIRKLGKDKVPSVMAKIAALNKMMESANTRIMAEIDMKKAKQEHQRLQQDLKQAQRERQEIKQRKDQGTRRIEQLQADAESAAAVARATKRDNQKELQEELQETVNLDVLIENAMKQVPDPKGLDEIESYMDKVTQDADMLFISNPDAIKQYEERKVALVKLRTELEIKKSDLDEKTSSVSTKQQYWKAQLQPIVDKINIVFAKQMEKLKVRGEVHLVSHETDFSKWCIDIRVSYRGESETHSLDGQAQSGGEKTMATIIYLTALQEQAKCPFRVVDEINQGVDERNERTIFKVVSDSACEDCNNPQMFMMCQKVVTDLDYHENMTILNIFNGPYNCTQRELLQ